MFTYNYIVHHHNMHQNMRIDKFSCLYFLVEEHFRRSRECAKHVVPANKIGGWERLESHLREYESAAQKIWPTSV